MAQVVLADEINRATPKTQSALLECMEERQATIDGTTYAMPDPFLVIATQNPIEYEGTFALPEAQLDRFMLRIRLGYPQPIEEVVILDEQKRTHPLEDIEVVCSVDELRGMQTAVRDVYVDSTVADYIVRLVNGTRSHPDVYLGASPRGSIALYRAGQALAGLLGRDYVIPDDIKALAEPALAHRLIIKTSASIHDVQSGNVDPRAARLDADRRHPPDRRPGRSAGDPPRPARARRAPRPSETNAADGRIDRLMRRLQLFLIAAILLIAAFSTGLEFLFYLVYLAIIVIGGSYIVTRLGLSDLEAGYAVSQLNGHVGDQIRVTYTLRNTSRVPKPWLEVHNPTTLPGGLPGRAIPLGPRAERSWLVRVPLVRRGHFRIEPLQIRTGDPFGFFEASASVGPGRRGRRLPADRADSAVAAAGGLPRGQQRVTRADAPDDAARDDGPAVGTRRQLQPDPLAGDGPPRRDPGQGVRARADRRRLDHPRPRAGDPDRPGRRVHGRGRGPGGRGRRPTRRSSRTARSASRSTPIARPILPADRGSRQHLKIMQLLAAVDGDGSTPLVETIVATAGRLRRGMTAIVITPSTDGTWIRPIASLRSRGIATVVVTVDAAGLRSRRPDRA